MRLIFCGCNEFQMPGMSLKGCVHDQFMLYEMFGGHRAKYDLLINEDFTRRNFFEHVQKAVDSGEVTWIGLSSHGTQIPHYGGDKRDYNEAYVCYDFDGCGAGMITDVEMCNIFRELPKGSGLFMDTCFSGSALTPGSWHGFAGKRHLPGIKPRFVPMRGVIPKVAQPGKFSIQQIMGDLGSKFVFGSCQDWETAADVSAGFGLGTKALWEAWQMGHSVIGEMVTASIRWLDHSPYAAIQMPTLTTGNVKMDLREILKSC